MCKNVINETAIKAGNIIRSIYLLLMIDNILVNTSLHFTQLHFAQLHFTTLVETSLLNIKLSPATLHSTSQHLSTLHFFPFKLPPTTRHYLLIWFNPI